MYHLVVDKILEILKREGVWHETFEHEPVRTSEEAAALRHGYALRQGAKALIVRVRGAGGARRFGMIVVPADRKFDGAKVKRVLGAKDIRFATEEEVGEVTGGVQVGGVPPFGTLFNIEVVADPTLFLNEKIVFNAGDRCFSVAMRSEDYQRIVCPEVREVV